MANYMALEDRLKLNGKREKSIKRVLTTEFQIMSVIGMKELRKVGVNLQ